jgi:hypothetical protein
MDRRYGLWIGNRWISAGLAWGQFVGELISWCSVTLQQQANSYAKKRFKK